MLGDSLGSHHEVNAVWVNRQPRVTGRRTIADSKAHDGAKFAKSGLDSGYLTTIPGIRITLFYSAPDFDPAALATDEGRKDVVPGSQLTTGLPVVTSTATLAIQVPVLTVLGGNDFTTCGPNPQGGDFDCSSGRAVALRKLCSIRRRRGSTDA